MKKIKLTKGQFALIDDEDYELLMQRSWCTNDTANINTYYAMARVNGKIVQMHRFILEHHGLLDASKQIDHIDKNGLNNRKLNLRNVTQAQNIANRRRLRNNTSGYIGVHFCHGLKKPWRAMIRANKQKYDLGYFANAHEAAVERDKAALKYHGEFATLNFPSD